MFRELEDVRIGVVGLGYVGLPLAVEFGRFYDTVGFDIDRVRVQELEAGTDRTLEVDASELAQAGRLSYSSDLEALRDCNVYIVTVPTPIDRFHNPDLTPLTKASESLAKVVGAGDVVIYESTVYPGATEEHCIPIIEGGSGLRYNQDFFAGYSPERINPGDKEHRLVNILKVTSGSTPEVADFVDALYASIITAGTHKASSLRVAEAAKVIENTQRDLNIALINELSLIFEKLGIDTLEVLEAAGTKWNFLPFRPGLVGGHCIGVDPYYLTYKAQEIGYRPEVIMAGRRINDRMGAYVAEKLVKAMITRKIDVAKSRVLVLGLTFKENCPDLRNTRVIDIVEELQGWGVAVDIHDPWIDCEEAQREYGVEVMSACPQQRYDAIVLAVGHWQFAQMTRDQLAGLRRDVSVLFDVKSVLPKGWADLRL
ncbi:Vi polysaccharide biosynthesis UDP-N-acetylglucosamine C-6 dehydrogenase TviB [Aestuariirhabdus litorea]|uniref:Vi polysaccharide biosynthesis UDP-N-acetylglucosamine C-6 dehydrogenase TviB n=1 Tax=Aestuariirhabdus litorea TaxID=2528527 RepID=A0A3P3VNL0_9GAMM|nr:Vi polysaccharide biosynthesis UDP-N-acetylglucosamine C-6 dehydrogenase TviB [Aestuariirhabdus litorea]RRJ84341.1 Vi polysaccharide biosynthesis UDP-N-acetylglucosamine C-6 dehydrogenase TviB [Aestuariirhabdus litorea]RWW97564.1 Vi polysaccharide biosynthesis UDP-N-acetylglucosamine C-6 dehydrogenase TviB [Endozoicomonadaceae bacterium GTF-13]